MCTFDLIYIVTFVHVYLQPACIMLLATSMHIATDCCLQVSWLFIAGGLYTEILPRGEGRIWGMEKRGGRKLMSLK